MLNRQVDSVTLPGSAGQFTAMQHHDNFITRLKSGTMYYRFNDEEGKPNMVELGIKNGFAEIISQCATVFVET